MAAIDEVVVKTLRSAAPAGQLDELNELWNGARLAANDQASVAAFVERLTTSGRRGLAIELLRRVAEDRQKMPWPMVMLAAQESAAGRHEAALAIGRTLEQRFPTFERSARVQLAALTKLRRFEEADRILARVEPMNTDAPWLLSEKAGLAEARADWATLLETAARWRALVPDNPHPVAMLIVSLTGLRRFDEAEALARETLSGFAAYLPLRRAHAALAEARGDTDQAFARWHQLCEAQPDAKAGFAGILTLARKTRRLDQMGDRLGQALARFPKDREILTQAAIIAGVDDWQEADRLWTILQGLHPNDPQIALNVATVMIGVRRERKKMLAEVLRRLEGVHQRFPEFVPAYVAHLEALRLAGNLDAAAARATDWAQRFPRDTKLALARIAVAEERGAYDDAIEQVQALRESGRPTPELEATYVRVLSRAGRHDEAEAACRATLQTHPDNRDLLSEYARLASRRADWPEAVSRWVEARRKRPQDGKIAEELRLLRQQLAGEDVEDTGAALSPEEASNVFSHFESLGGTTTGCEFGMVQSHYDSRHVSLLRWTKSDIDVLIEALDCDFEGVGAEENTLLTTVRVSADREEYVTADKRFDMASNTFINVADAPADKMFQQTCRRLRFLTGKLIEDLHAAEKIFVFKVAHAVREEKLCQLHRALRRYGDVKLLCVLQAQLGHPAGTVHWLEPGLLVGYVTYFLHSPESGGRWIEFDIWRKVTMQADMLFNQAKQVAAQ